MAQQLWFAFSDSTAWSVTTRWIVVLGMVAIIVIAWYLYEWADESARWNRRWKETKDERRYKKYENK